MSLGTLDKDAFAKLSHESFVVYLWDFHRVILFWLIPQPSRLLKQVLG